MCLGVQGAHVGRALPHTTLAPSARLFSTPHTLRVSPRRWCEACNAPVPHPVYRYLVNLTISDHTGNAWVTAFGEQVGTGVVRAWAVRAWVIDTQAVHGSPRLVARWALGVCAPKG